MLDLEPIKARLTASTASEGHWSFNKDDSTLYMHEDAVFIANAPMDTANLIVEVEKLRAALEKNRIYANVRTIM